MVFRLLTTGAESFQVSFSVTQHRLSAGHCLRNHTMFFITRYMLTFIVSFLSLFVIVRRLL